MRAFFASQHPIVNSSRTLNSASNTAGGLALRDIHGASRPIGSMLVVDIASKVFGVARRDHCVYHLGFVSS